MRIEDTAGNVYIKPENCDCGLTGGCDKCRGYRYNSNNRFYPSIPEYYYFPQYYPVRYVDFHEWMQVPIRCPNCGKILKPHICGEDN